MRLRWKPARKKPLSASSKSNFKVRASFAIFLGALFLSCVTTPPDRSQEHWFRYLPPYPQVFLDVKPVMNRTFFQEAFRDHSLGGVIDRSVRMLMGLEVSRRGVSLRGVVLGDFPKGLGGLYLDLEEGFQKTPGPREQWASDTGLYVRLVEDGVVAVASTPFEEVITLDAGFPADLPQLEIDRPVTIVLPNPGESFLGDRGDNLLPISKVFLFFEGEDRILEGRMEVQLKDGPHARLGVVFTKLFWKTLKVSLFSKVDVGEPQFTQLERGGVATGWSIDPQGLITLVDTLFSTEEESVTAASLP
jgi:hypothetical protein